MFFKQTEDLAYLDPGQLLVKIQKNFAKILWAFTKEQMLITLIRCWKKYPK